MRSEDKAVISQDDLVQATHHPEGRILLSFLTFSTHSCVLCCSPCASSNASQTSTWTSSACELGRKNTFYCLVSWAANWRVQSHHKGAELYSRKENRDFPFLVAARKQLRSAFYEGAAYVKTSAAVGKLNLRQLKIVKKCPSKMSRNILQMSAIIEIMQMLS